MADNKKPGEFTAVEFYWPTHNSRSVFGTDPKNPLKTIRIKSAYSATWQPSKIRVKKDSPSEMDEATSRSEEAKIVKDAAAREPDPSAIQTVRDSSVYIFRVEIGSFDDPYPVVDLYQVFNVDQTGTITIHPLWKLDDTFIAVVSQFLLPSVIGRKRQFYFAIASRIDVAPDDVQAWVTSFLKSHQVTQEFPDGLERRTIEPSSHFILIDPGDKSGLGRDWGRKDGILRFPVTAPFDTALNQAKTLEKQIETYRKEHDPTYSSGNMTRRSTFAKRTLVVALGQAMHKDLVTATREPAGQSPWDFALGAEYRATIRREAKHRAAIELAADDLTEWLRRPVVSGWLDLCATKGRGLPGGGKTAQPDKALERMVSDAHAWLEPLDATLCLGRLAETALKQAKTGSGFWKSLLFDGGGMKAVVRQKALASQALGIHKVVLGRLVSRGELKIEEAVDALFTFTDDAGIGTDVKSGFSLKTTWARLNQTPWSSSSTDYYARIYPPNMPKLQKALAHADLASDLVGMVGWFEFMASINAYSEKRNMGATSKLDDAKIAASIASQSISTIQFISTHIGGHGAKAASTKMLSSMAFPVAVVDAAFKFGDAKTLMAKGDEDAALALQIASVTALAGSILTFTGVLAPVGVVLLVISGITAFASSLMADSVWDTFFIGTSWGKEVPKPSNWEPAYAPDWAGAPILAMHDNPERQLKALANLMSNFTVQRWRVDGGIPGLRIDDDGWGGHELRIELMVPDPFPVFHLRWEFGGLKLPGSHYTVNTIAAPQIDGKQPPSGWLPDPYHPGADVADHIQGSVRCIAVKEKSFTLHVGVPALMDNSDIGRPTSPSVTIRRLINHFPDEKNFVNKWTPAKVNNRSIMVNLLDTNPKMQLFTDV